MVSIHLNVLELAEDVRVLRGDTGGLEHSDTESEDAADLQLARQSVTTLHLGVRNVSQFQV